MIENIAGAPARGDAELGRSNALWTVRNAAASGRFVINVTHGRSVATAPTGLATAIAEVLNFYESNFSDPITGRHVSGGVGEQQYDSARGAKSCGSIAAYRDPNGESVTQNISGTPRAVAGISSSTAST